jgi:hypothetical protein
MSRRAEILLVALVTLILAALSSAAGWLRSGGEVELWEAWLMPVAAMLFAGLGALAWAGWGRWLLSQSGAGNPSRKLWRLWFVPWAMWAFDIVREPLARSVESNGFPDGPALLAAAPVYAVGLFGGLAVLLLVLVFGFREIGYLLRQRKARRGSG